MSCSARFRRRLTTILTSRLGAENESHNINAVHPSNVVISTNVGESSSRHFSSGSQTVRVQQRDGKVVETEHREIGRREGGKP
jgi:hypothetical protein